MSENEPVGYRDRQGNPIDVLRWGELWGEFEDYRRIAESNLPNGILVITVWQGIVSPVAEGLFYTAVFSEGGRRRRDLPNPPLEEFPTNTEEEARAAHWAAVARWTGAQTGQEPH